MSDKLQRKKHRLKAFLKEILHTPSAIRNLMNFKELNLIYIALREAT